MNTKIIIESMIDYHVTATRITWDIICDMVSEAEFVRDLTFSWGSLRNEMVHIANVDRRWLAGLKELKLPATPDFEKYPDLASAKAFSDAVLDELTAYVQTIAEEDLNALPQKIPSTRWQILLHIANHGTDHRARILSMLDRLGKDEFDQDYFYYLLEKAKSNEL